MASRRQRRQERKAAAVRRFLAAQTPGWLCTAPQSTPTPTIPAEPLILREHISKLVDFGVEQRTIDYLHKAGIHFVRDVPGKGREEIRKIYGMKSRLPQVESVLQSFGVTFPE